MARTVLVSSCLLGLATRYDGDDNYSRSLADYLQRNDLIPIPVCPEQLAGMPTPRPKCWYTTGTGAAILAGEGQICNELGVDVSQRLLRGAELTLDIARLTNCELAILKQRSPSCGSSMVHQNGKLVEGMGVAAALLAQHGVALLSEEELEAKSE